MDLTGPSGKAEEHYSGPIENITLFHQVDLFQGIPLSDDHTLNQASTWIDATVELSMFAGMYKIKKT